MTGRVYNVLFLCTGNSARSIFGEALLNHRHREQFRGFSAGSHPTGAVQPYTLQTLRELGISTDGLRSKSWDEFTRPGAPMLDFAFTVCDKAAKESCPFWPGQPMTAHWGVPDPVVAEGFEEQKLHAFLAAALTLQRRIDLFLSIPVEKLDAMAIKHRIDEIGRSQ